MSELTSTFLWLLFCVGMVCAVAGPIMLILGWFAPYGFFRGEVKGRWYRAKWVLFWVGLTAVIMAGML